MSLHGHVAVQKYAQLANRLCRLGSRSPQTENGSLGTRCCSVADDLKHTRVLLIWRHLAVSG